MKQCTKCKESKPLDGFYKNRNFPDGRAYFCIECIKKDHRERALNPKRKRDMRHNHLKFQYGIGIDEYEQMLESQGGVCKLCLRPERKLHSQYKILMPLAVDHNHATGEVRGLLCSDCNMLLGRIESSPELVKMMLEYLGLEVFYGN